ncbi:MAG: prepilin peptidase [Parcubacteria group bacterium]|nr:prepilin peptidase [Parcubacteria group bacterium]
MLLSFVSIFVVIFGLLVGSFLNVVIYRLKVKKTVVRGRSFCPHCQHTLRLIDLIPLFSFIFQKGRCRYCNKKISWQYPLVELVTATTFLLVFFKFPIANVYLSEGSEYGTLLAGYLVFTAVLIIIFTYDLKHYLIPDRIVLPATILALAFSWINPNVDWLPALIGSVMVGGFFALIIFLTKGKGMGWGDVKLGLFVGALLGWQVSLLALLIAFVSGSIVGVGLILAKKKGWKSQVPFGTFLTVATFICLLWGEEIVQWYVGMLELG